MGRAALPADVPSPIDGALLAAAARRAAATTGGTAEPAKSIDHAVETLYDAITGLLPSVFVLEHGRLWLVAQRGYAVAPDGIRVESGIMGRAVRSGRPQLAPDVHADPDYIGALPGVGSELAVPLRAGRMIVGVLNIESERALPDGSVGFVQPLASALAPPAEALRASGTLDLAALARLFVHLGSLRDPDEIAALAAASLPKVLPIEGSQVVVWDELGTPVELASWRTDGSRRAPLSRAELAAARAQVKSDRRLPDARPKARTRTFARRELRRLAAAPRERRRARCACGNQRSGRACRRRAVGLGRRPRRTPRSVARCSFRSPP